MLSGVKCLAGGLAVALGLTAPARAAPLRALPGHVPAAVAGLQPIGRLEGSQRLKLAIGLPLRNQPELEALLRQLYDPASTNYHRYLTPDQFAARFGPTWNDYGAVIAFAQSAGLKVTGKYANRALLDVSGPAAQIEKAFHVNLRLYNHPSEARRFYAPDVEPSVDAALPILHVSGLDNFQLPRPAGLKFSDGRESGASSRPAIYPAPGAPAPQISSGPGGSYIGNDFRAAYVPGVSLDGTGQKIGLLEFDGYVSNDIAAYETAAGLPSVTLANVPVDGFDGSAGATADEVSLDIEMVISMAPSISQVIVYEIEPGGLGDDVLNAMATDTNLARQLSSSWLFPTTPTTTQILRQFAAQSQSYFNSSGDTDAYSGPIATPADNAYATIVGGTALSTSAPGGPWLAETVWSENDGTGSGGGVSATVPIPSWQQPVNMSYNMGSPTLRNIPDVACAARNIWLIFGGGGTHVVSGTSCAAPLWAGFTALVNQQAAVNEMPPVGFLNPALYQIGLSSNYTQAFHDIVVGNNTNSGSPNEFFAVAGYDLCTGWGTPNGQTLIDLLAPTQATTPPNTLQVLPGAGFVSSGPVGGPFSVTAENFELTNTASSPAGWTLSLTAPWLDASASSGSVNPGAAGNVSVTVSPSVLALAAGIYGGSAVFTNLANGRQTVRTFTLDIFDPLIVGGTADFAAAGPAGGPFSVSAGSFVLTNGGPKELMWAATAPPWLGVSPASGALSPGQGSVIVQVSLNSAASNLVKGIYSGSVVFSNLTSGTAQSQPVTLAVGQPIVENGGFETGNFSDWTISGNGIAVSAGTNHLCVHSGRYGALLGPPFTLGYLSQTVPTAPGQTYLISLWLDSPDGDMPNEFLVSWNGYLLFDKTNLAKLGWTNIQVLAASSGPTSILQFGFRDDLSYLGLDDVSATLVAQPPPPAFESVAQTGSNLVSTWSAIPGASYQLQSTSDLNLISWSNVGTVITANSSIAFATNAITGSQQFYRLLQINAP